MIRIAKTETAQDVHTVEEPCWLLRRVWPSRRFHPSDGCPGVLPGVLNALEVCQSSERLIGIALSGGDYTKDLQTSITGTGWS